jgi:hypothetical protein
MQPRQLLEGARGDALAFAHLVACPCEAQARPAPDLDGTGGESAEHPTRRRRGAHETLELRLGFAAIRSAIRAEPRRPLREAPVSCAVECRDGERRRMPLAADHVLPVGTGEFETSEQKTKVKAAKPA